MHILFFSFSLYGDIFSVALIFILHVKLQAKAEISLIENYFLNYYCKIKSQQIYPGKVIYLMKKNYPVQHQRGQAELWAVRNPTTWVRIWLQAACEWKYVPSTRDSKILISTFSLSSLNWWLIIKTVQLFIFFLTNSFFVTLVKNLKILYQS